MGAGEEQRKILAGRWLEKAAESMASAHGEYVAGRYAICVNRLYFSVFYAVSAALVAQGKRYGKHSAVRAAFNRDFLRKGWLQRNMQNFITGFLTTE